MADKRIIVTQCRVVTSGTGRNQRPYTIYEVEALRDDRTPLPPDLKLRSFEDLPLNEVIDVSMTKYDSPQYGVSWTIQRTGKGGGGLAKEVGDLKERIEGLEQNMDRLAQHVYGSGSAPTPAPTATAAPAAAGSPGVPTDDDVPF